MPFFTLFLLTCTRTNSTPLLVPLFSRLYLYVLAIVIATAEVPGGAPWLRGGVRAAAAAAAAPPERAAAAAGGGGGAAAAAAAGAARKRRRRGASGRCGVIAAGPRDVRGEACGGHVKEACGVSVSVNVSKSQFLGDWWVQRTGLALLNI